MSNIFNLRPFETQQIILKLDDYWFILYINDNKALICTNDKLMFLWKHNILGLYCKVSVCSFADMVTVREMIYFQIIG